MSLEELHRFEDIHTHVKAGPNSICSLPPREAISLCHTKEKQPFSIELHPWYATPELLAEFLDACEICRDDPRFVAVGECGLDRLCETSMEVQKKCFHEALLVAKQLDKPVILHVVKAWDEMFEMANHLTYPSTIKIIHGFRKNVAFAQQLVSQGFCLSLGNKFNPEVPAVIPADRIFYETDNTKTLGYDYNRDYPA